jgi:hypothetical protein
MLLTVNVQARRSESTLRSVFSDRQQIESRRADAQNSFLSAPKIVRGREIAAITQESSRVLRGTPGTKEKNRRAGLGKAGRSGSLPESCSVLAWPSPP